MEMIKDIPFPRDESTIMEVMDERLKHQAGIAWYQPFEVNTVRCVVREPPQFPSKKAALEFSWGEMLQNATDFPEPVLVHKDTKFVHDKEKGTLLWTLDGDVGFGVRNLSNCIDLQQPGLPLSLDCIGTGTASKNAISAGAGGFGDGSKTGAHAFCFYGFRMQFLFFCYNKNDMGSVVVWSWVAKVFDGFKEPHMGVEITVVRNTYEEYQHLKQPTMITRVSRSDGDAAALQLLREAFVSALSRFKLLYTEVPDTEGLTIKAIGFGSWQRSKTFVPIIDSFIEYKVELPKRHRSCLVLVSGIFYLYVSHNMSTSLVIVVQGKGIPGSQFQVFTNQLREISGHNLSRVFVRQFDEFASIEANRDALVSAMKPLLVGGSSFLVDNRPHSMVLELMNDMECRTMLRNLLLFWRLSPTTWSVDEKEAAAQRREVNKRVKNAVIADEVTFPRIQYCEWLCGNCDNVVTVGQDANYQLFFPVPIDEETHKAAKHVLRDSKHSKNIARPVDKAFNPAIKYIGGSMTISVVRIHQKPPQDIESFAFRTPDRNIIVIPETEDDPEKIVNGFTPHMIADASESKRSTQFFMHFVGNDARCMRLGERVRYAVRCAATNAPYDIGSVVSKRKYVAFNSDEEVSDIEDPFELLKKNVKMAKKPKTAPVCNGPRIKTPYTKTIPAGITEVGLPSANNRPELEHPEEVCEQTWDEDHQLFMPTDSTDTLPSNIISIIGTFNRVVDIIRQKIDVKGAQIYPSYSPNETWGGYYIPETNMALVNLYYVTTAEKMIVVTVHELAHHDAAFHDAAHGRAMMSRFQKILVGLLPL